LQLASKYDAITNWYEGFGGLKRTYTVDVEHALIERPKGKPIIAEGEVQDVFRREDLTWIRLSNRLSALFSLGPNIDFEISCPEGKLGPIFEHREVFDTFVVVATIRRVHKAALKLTAIASSEKDPQIELASPLFPPFDDRFLAIGDCLDIAYVGGMAEVPSSGGQQGMKPEKKKPM
jgi:hypothetical protein